MTELAVEIDADALAALTPEQDTEAPYGRKADGTPKAKPGAKAGARPRRPRGGRKKAERAPKFDAKLHVEPELPTGGATTAAIEKALASLLALPAMPCAIIGDTYCQAHFEVSAPVVAHQLAKASETSPGLRRQLEKLIVGDTNMVIFMAAFMYIIPPLAHHGIVPRALVRVVGAPEPPAPPPPVDPEAEPLFTDEGVPVDAG